MLVHLVPVVAALRQVEAGPQRYKLPFFAKAHNKRVTATRSVIGVGALRDGTLTGRPTKRTMEIRESKGAFRR
ncbi:hypothetical protein GCM10023214_05070 [Amycolatopsis dongchuanensis]|uniref:Secreted protein n=1 Tax=Amycolatopsis dongchuanensis TaxID=1070866 RepID=A0ABP9PV92_9PSEU